jgi:D,D-heptose 1,7-bisphosphate phosphatase
MNNLVILCGGRGTRISKYTKSLPKPLIRFHNISFLQYLINFYSQYDFKKIYLLTGYKSHIVKKKFHKKKFNLVSCECIVEKKPLGTAGALGLLPRKLKNFFLINGDSFVNYDFLKFKEFCKSRSHVMALIKNLNYKSNKKLSNLSLDFKNKVSFSSKSNFMNAGIYYFKKNLINSINKKISLEEEVLFDLITKKKLFGKKIAGKFIDIGLYKNIIKAKKILSKQKKPSIFFDRDGVLFKDIGYLFNFKKIKWLNSLFSFLKINNKKFHFFIVTNQSGIGRGYFSKKQFFKLHIKIKKFFLSKNIVFQDIEFCPHHPVYAKGPYKKNCKCRKPGNLMIERLFSRWLVDRKRSFFFGDKYSDYLAAKKSRLKFIYINEKKGFQCLIKNFNNASLI